MRMENDNDKDHETRERIREMILQMSGKPLKLVYDYAYHLFVKAP